MSRQPRTEAGRALRRWALNETASADSGAWSDRLDDLILAIEDEAASPDRAAPDTNAWLARLVKAERENHCGDKACMTRRVSAAVRVLTGGKEHQDYCWAIEAFEAELGIRDPALVGAEPSDAILDAASSAAALATPDTETAE